MIFSIYYLKVMIMMRTLMTMMIKMMTITGVGHNPRLPSCIYHDGDDDHDHDGDAYDDDEYDDNDADDQDDNDDDDNYRGGAEPTIAFLYLS